MTPPQIAFVAALSAILAVIVAFGVYVVRLAARNTGERSSLPGLLVRLGRSPRDRVELGRWAFYAHRISGVAIFGFLALHLVDVGLYAISPTLYDEVHIVYGSPPMRVIEVALLVAILFHALNGLRLLLIDVIDLRPHRSAQLLWACVLATVVFGAAGGYVILSPLIAGVAA